MFVRFHRRDSTQEPRTVDAADWGSMTLHLSSIVIGAMVGVVYLLGFAMGRISRD
jgi:hypothetical protein